MSIKKIVLRILSHRRDLTRKEVEVAIEEKRVASEGYLTHEAAARLIAAELGVKIARKRPHPQILIKHLISGLNDVTVSGRVLLVNRPKAFSRRDGSGGTVARLQIADQTARIRVVGWDNKAELIEKIHPREIVRIRHAYTRRSKNGQLEVHIGERGSIEIQPPDLNENDYPPIESFLTKISHIDKGNRNINVEGITRRINQISIFQRKDGTQGKVIRAILKDETAEIPVVLWNRIAEEATRIKEGDKVLLMNTKARENQREKLLELHLNNSSNIEIIPRDEHTLNIKDLKEGTRISSIEGIVTTEPLLKRVTTRKGEEVSVASFELEDETGKIRVSAWREHAKKIEKLTVGTRVKLKNLYVKKKFKGLLEISTSTSTEIETREQT
ncbi:hypothetical protein KAU87_01380 [Candidatus Bathyarchaeota archaeon]|nr:hypothetical protein [Candidatus Bathyarchaeota archaeon]